MRRNKSVSFGGKPKFAIIVDGECEVWYINMLKRNEKSLNFDLKPEIPQKKKLSDQYEKVKELAKDYDKVFWVIDFDVINRETLTTAKGTRTSLQEFKEYYEDLKNNYRDNVIIVINNPCLEYWYLLHYKAISKYFESCNDAVKQLKKYLVDYEKTQKFYTKQNNDIYLRLKPNLSKAITNAKKLGDFDIDNNHSGMSQMQLIIDAIKVEI